MPGMGAQDYIDLQNHHKRASNRGYKGMRNAFLAVVALSGVLYADTQTTFIRDTVQQITGSPMKSIPYIYRLENLFR